MPDRKISELSEKSTIVDADLIPIVDMEAGPSATKKITFANLILRIKTLFKSTFIFIQSGASHSAGLVPDPGATAGSVRLLREDASFVSIVNSGSSFSEITSSGNWVAPTNVTNIFVEVGGGGGGGGAGLAGGSDTSGGGGGGGEVRKSFIVVVPGASYSITIGGGGTGSTGSVADNSTAGGNTTAFGITANGGERGREIYPGGRASVGSGGILVHSSAGTPGNLSSSGITNGGTGGGENGGKGANPFYSAPAQSGGISSGGGGGSGAGAGADGGGGCVRIWY